MSGAERVALTRQRAREAMLRANEDLSGATDKAILGNLERQIQLMTDPDYNDTARAIAGQLMAELARRHSITIG
jgi:predicted nucleic acid-binding protein